MARTVRDANLETRTARSRLLSRKKPYYRVIDQGCHLGYYKGARAASWSSRYFVGGGRYVEMTLGLADDATDADGIKVLSFSQAQAKAREWFAEQARGAAGAEKVGKYTVKDALTDYQEWLDVERPDRSLQVKRDMRCRIKALIEPEFGKTDVSKLTTRAIRRWHLKLATSLPRMRSRSGAPIRYRDNSNDPEAERKRRHSANRVLTVLKAALNHAWRERRVPNDDAWRRVRPFREVDAARIRYLTDAESVRLVNACSSDFRKLVQAALLTGGRYGELISARASDFDERAGCLLIRRSKSGKPRRIVLTEEGIEFFSQVCAGRSPEELALLRHDGKAWNQSHQIRRLKDACSAARIEPAVSFHILRHTYASRLAMKGTPLAVIAEQLGHADTRMVEKHYAHLAPSYVAETVRANFGRLGIIETENVVSLSGEVHALIGPPQ